MKRQLFSFLLCAAMLLGLGACGETEEPASDYQLYFTVSPSVDYGSALAPQNWERESDQAPDAGELLSALLEGPTQEGLTSPFPKGTAIQSIGWDEDESGTLQVMLTEQYDGLTDISRTLADYCIVLTLSQIPEVSSVEVGAVGIFGVPRSRKLSASEVDMNTLLP